MTHAPAVLALASAAKSQVEKVTCGRYEQPNLDATAGFDGIVFDTLSQR